MPPTTLQLDPAAARALRARLPEVSESVVAAVVAEVPSYSAAFSGPMAQTIRTAVALALAGFLDRVSPSRGRRPVTEESVRSGAYSLGRGEARAGRSMDALLAAYRVGARVAWRAMSDTAVEAGLSADRVVIFAELVFAFIDDLSAVSVAGHSDELETTGRVRERLRERLGRALLSGAPDDDALRVARRAEWEPPDRLTAVLVAPAEVRGILTALGAAGAETLVVTEEAPDLPDDTVVLLIPDVGRPVLRRTLRDRQAVLGPERPWLAASASYRRALRAQALPAVGLVDTEEHLAELVLGADADALVDLRARVLAPLEPLRPASRDKLTETLRAWLLCQGRRDDVAALLFVHPQTVRYRVGQLRELFGDRLDDPDAVLELVLALGARSSPSQ
ncbi:PucR family transcriptional regulator [Nocardioides terrisoli]|uniref:PucR family transcriptional regulator n=1 Tax=Nocardioides terrisoli TaxID=3388267 RepID=UPI00287B8145|nr:helix-turn-helix domain-containing protein [Nocardioides marmorisolisilvae]